jgi:hypothetical protein
MPVTSHTTTMHLLTQVIVTHTSTELTLIVIAGPMHIESMWTLITERRAMNMGVENKSCPSKL